MKRVLFIIEALMLCAMSWAKDDGVDIKIKVRDYLNSPVVLGYYYDGKMLVKDTVMTDGVGVAKLQQTDKLAEGVYVIYFPEKMYFDIIIGDNQKWELSCDTMPEAVKRVKVTGDKMLSEFIDYQNYLQAKHGVFRDLQQQYKEAEGNTARQEDIKAKLSEADKEVKTKNAAIIDAHKGDCLAVFLTGLKDVEIPEFDMSAYPEAERDSILREKRYYYYRAHYFDNLPLGDDRILRTPYFVQKLDKYMTDILPQIPDTIAEESLKLIRASESNEETFKYMTSHLYNMANNSKIMGMDAALVAIADNYYLAGKCKWAEKEFVDKLREQVGKIRYTLIGKTAMDLKRMPGVNQGEYYTLSEVDAPYTILVFWEPSCGHCKKEIPELKKQVWDNYAKTGIKIFAVYCQDEREPWEKFIEENQLDEWMNVYDPYRRTNFRTYYNINSTPQIFILDKDKKIIAKRIGVDQIGGFLDHMFGLEK